MDNLQDLWDNLLSREPVRVIEAWGALTDEEQLAVLTHLQRMVSEDGWLEVQRQSAQAALAALDAHRRARGDAPNPD